MEPTEAEPTSRKAIEQQQIYGVHPDERCRKETHLRLEVAESDTQCAGSKKMIFMHTEIEREIGHVAGGRKEQGRREAFVRSHISPHQRSVEPDEYQLGRIFYGV